MDGTAWAANLSPEERLLAEQAVMNARALNRACDEAADGTVLAVAERLAMEQGRELIRRTLEVSLGGQRAPLEKKGRRPAPAPVDGAASTAGNAPARS